MYNQLSITKVNGTTRIYNYMLHFYSAFNFFKARFTVLHI